MEVFEAIKSRRSIRSYVPSEVNVKQLETILEAARWAPSAGNLQPWEFIVVDDRDIMRALARASLNQMWMIEASYIVAVCADLDRTGMIYGERGRRLYSIQDCAAATQNMLLAAHSLGLGTCWIGAFYEDEVKKILKLPDNVRPLALVTIGRPRETPAPPARRRLEEIVHYNAFGKAWSRR
ncbi:MAG: nitroreductase family protein [Candidatus Nezhaarchaeota archaeon]|nr:nitroreductase family protein [Candidatus Nezhaarchaeota archaeon]MCX8142033.1 nitroreductase family protein [Candidatus Nezhaarchaeota archaeon]MDW8050186.1 nitroreductase family protein [Nitrososphaerota archaeon]